MTPRPGKYIPTRVLGAAAELRALLQHAHDPDITAISLVPPRSGSRTPDMVVRYRHGTGRGLERIEITTVTGAGSGYQTRGRGRTRPVTAAEIGATLIRKAQHGQLTRPLSTRDLGPIPPRGTIDIIAPGVSPAVIRRAIAIAAPAIAAAAPGVRRVIVRPGGPPIRFRRRGGP